MNNEKCAFQAELRLANEIRCQHVYEGRLARPLLGASVAAGSVCSIVCLGSSSKSLVARLVDCAGSEAGRRQRVRHLRAPALRRGRHHGGVGGRDSPRCVHHGGHPAAGHGEGELERLFG